MKLKTVCGLILIFGGVGFLAHPIYLWVKYEDTPPPLPGFLDWGNEYHVEEDRTPVPVGPYATQVYSRIAHFVPGSIVIGGALIVVASLLLMLPRKARKAGFD